MDERAKKRCQRCGAFLAGAVTVLCAACMPINASAAVPHHHGGQEIAAVVAEHPEPQHVPDPEYGMIRDELKPAAFPPPATSPVRRHMLRGRPLQRTRGRSFGQYVVTNEDGTTRIVTSGMMVG